MFVETSDEFFARRDVRAELGGRPVDLALIDGLHHFEYALRDFMNLERLCTPQSTILIDDCFPHDRRTAERERFDGFWSGDVWKVVVLLKKYRPDLSIHTVAAPPTGMCVVRNLDPGSRFIADNLQRLVDEFTKLDYGYLEKQRGKKLNLFPNDWERIRSLLGS
jgi:Methyltransferase domain